MVEGRHRASHPAAGVSRAPLFNSESRLANSTSATLDIPLRLTAQSDRTLHPALSPTSYTQHPHALADTSSRFAVVARRGPRPRSFAKGPVARGTTKSFEIPQLAQLVIVPAFKLCIRAFVSQIHGSPSGSNSLPRTRYTPTSGHLASLRRRGAAWVITLTPVPFKFYRACLSSRPEYASLYISVEKTSSPLAVPPFARGWQWQVLQVLTHRSPLCSSYGRSKPQ